MFICYLFSLHHIYILPFLVYFMFNNFFKKGISSVVATALLLVVTVVSFVIFNGWFSSYFSNVLTDIDVTSELDITFDLDQTFKIHGLIDNYLYVYNDFDGDLNVTSLRINDVECSLNNLHEGMNSIDVSDCLSGVTSFKPNIMIITSKGFVEKIVEYDHVPSFVCDSFPPYGFAGGDGSLGSPWQICSCLQLQDVSLDLGGNYSLTNDVDCGISPFNVGLGFSKIGNCTGSCNSGGDDFAFTGRFDGAGFVINDLYINDSLSDEVGLFAFSNGATIIDVNLVGTTIYGIDSVGSLVGYNKNTNVSDSFAIGNVIGNSVGGDFVGGLIGYAYANSYLDNLYFIGNVSGHGKIGGLIGYNKFWVTLNNSYANVGTIYGSYDVVGGLVGSNEENIVIKNSYVIGTGVDSSIVGDDFIGGLVGYISEGVIDNSYTNVKVNATKTDAGGLVGLTYDSDITNSYAVGDVFGQSQNVGGLVGYLWINSLVDNSYAMGNVFGMKYSNGGLVGYLSYHSVIDNSYSTGFVNGDEEVGGLVGRTYNADITNSYTVSSVNGSHRVGGLVGYHFYNANIDNSYALGNVSGNDTVGGFIGFNSYGTDIDNSYSAGLVVANFNVGGFIGVDDASGTTVTNSYWDNESSNQSSSVDGVGISTSGMKAEATFVGWDFSGVWNIVEGVSYPTLVWE